MEGRFNLIGSDGDGDVGDDGDYDGGGDKDDQDII